MPKLKLWFLDVGHGDCTYIELPNGARMMIDCGCGDEHWPSKMLNYYKINKTSRPVSIPGEERKYGLDKLIITHPHGDHIADIEAIHDQIAFCWLQGTYRPFVDKLSVENIDFRKRNESAVKKFIEVVKEYTGDYLKERDRTIMANPPCMAHHKRFISFEDNIDLNELSWFSSFVIGGQKILFTGDMTATGVNKILQSNEEENFRNFVKGTTLLKVPHHGRQNGCSQELFDAFERKPLLCIVSDEVLNDKNEGTSVTQWYYERTSEESITINGSSANRRVLTTRNDKDIYVEVDENGNIAVTTNNFAADKTKILIG